MTINSLRSVQSKITAQMSCQNPCVISGIQKLWSYSVLVAQSCLTLCDPMDSSLQVSSIQEILLARILEWVAISFFRGSFRARKGTWVSCIAGIFFYCLSHHRSPGVLELQVRHRQLGYIYIIYMWRVGLGHNVRCVSWYMHTQIHYSYFTDEESETQTG